MTDLTIIVGALFTVALGVWLVVFYVKWPDEYDFQQRKRGWLAVWVFTIGTTLLWGLAGVITGISFVDGVVIPLQLTARFIRVISIVL